ncbi:MAG: 9-O-acetylesterase [Verrucomicrobia bacterium]|nr:9-O-acetylesterase [Verrucomicrobiota bacterium]
MKHILSLAQVALLAAALAVVTPASANVKLPHVFGSHMVLQRDQALPVWGWADPDEKVSVQIGDQPAVTATANKAGEWSVTLPKMAAGGPFVMKIAGKNTVTLEDVLVGEVWLCSGQSNMEMVVASCVNAQQEIAAANYPKIRTIKVPKLTASVPARDFPGEWQVCSPETAGGFTACGFFMARELQKKLNVPIGLINSSWGGTRIEPWTTPAGFAQVPTLADIQQKIAKADPHAAEFKEGLGKYLDKVEAWTQATRQSITQEKLIAPMPEFPQEFVPLAARPGPHGQPTTLYNAMIQPLVPFAIRGAIWYQGESNHAEGKLYTEKMKALVKSWRLLWNCELPFYYVQIAPFPYGNENPAVLAEFWEAQAAALEIPNTGMVVISDVGDYKDIHPKNKQEVGRRLALLALKNLYGQNDLICSGPTFKAMVIEGDKIRVRFDNIGGGLASRDGKPLNWFEIIGKETDWTKAAAAIEGDSVVLSSAKVTAPVAMRFAWNKSAEPNLMNKEGLPASAFRSGKEPQVDILSLNVPEAKDYELLYALDLAKAGKQITYDVDRRAQIIGPIDRVAYFLELRKQGEPAQWVYVSMDTFTTDLSKLGVPTVASKAKFQTKVSHMNVLSSDPRITAGNDLAGNIEFCPHNYGPRNAAGIPNASDGVWDFGDEISDPEDGYGCMQIHNFNAKQTLFALNNWKAGSGADLGIGNSDPHASGGRTLDWTFNHNAAQYVVKQLKVLVRLKK